MVQIRQREAVPNPQQISSTLTMTALANEALNDSLILNAGSQSQNERIFGPFSSLKSRCRVGIGFATLANERMNNKSHAYKERSGDDLGDRIVFLQIR